MEHYERKEIMKLQRFGGYAAIASVLIAVAYLLYVYLLAKPAGGDISDLSKFRDLVSTAPLFFYAVPLLLLIFFSLHQIMFFALNERMQNKAPQLALISLIASSAGTTIMVAASIFIFDNVRIALQHELPEKIIEARWTFYANYQLLKMAAGHIHGWAYLLMGCAILRIRPFSVALGWLFVVTGLLNITGFMLFQLEAAGHLCIFVAAVWIGIAMLRQKLPQPVMEEMAVSK
jgi:hypothetical protein